MNSLIVEHQQFDMIVRLMNAALQDDSDMDEYGIAATLLPLSTVFGRRLTKGVIQFVYTLIQVGLITRLTIRIVNILSKYFLSKFEKKSST